MKRFGSFYKAVLKDNKRPSFNNGFIDSNGVLWVTNLHIVVMSQLEDWNIIDLESVPLSSGAVLSSETLKNMSGLKVRKIKFTESTVDCFDSKGEILSSNKYLSKGFNPNGCNIEGVGKLPSFNKLFDTKQDIVSYDIGTCGVSTKIIGLLGECMNLGYNDAVKLSRNRKNVILVETPESRDKAIVMEVVISEF